MQMNISITPETRDCLIRVKDKLHCATMSETICRLAWDADHSYKPVSEESAAVYHGSLMDSLKLKIMIERFTEAFKHKRIINSYDFEQKARSNEISTEDNTSDSHILVWSNNPDFLYKTPLRSAVHSFFDAYATVCILKAPEYPAPNDWIKSDDITPWKFHGTTVKMITDDNDPDKVIGFELVPSNQGDKDLTDVMRFIWNKETCKFDTRMIEQDEAKGLIHQLF